MAESASLPPASSSSLGGIRPPEREGKTTSLTPPDKLSDFSDSQGSTSPPYADQIAALAGGSRLKAEIANLSTTTISESDLQKLLQREPLPGPQKLSALVAFLHAVPLPIKP